jgi:hypothetical protein
MGKLEAGQRWAWKQSGDVFEILEVASNIYLYRYEKETFSSITFKNSFEDHEYFVAEGRLWRVTPLMEALL